MTHPGASRAAGAFAAAALLALLPGCRDVATDAGAAPAPGPLPSVTTPPTAVDLPPGIRSFRADRTWAPVADPTAVRIPAIEVASELERLGIDAAGAVEVPSWPVAGWYSGGPKPGQAGPAVILGHVDSPAGAAVFARLHELRPGDEVLVDRADGSTARFLVERLERHPKGAFPTDAVYGPDLRTGLRLVTCGGSFDRTTGHYRDNVIAFAVAP